MITFYVAFPKDKKQNFEANWKKYDTKQHI